VNSIGIAGKVTTQVEGASTGPSNWWVALTSFLVLIYETRALLRSIAVVHALAWKGSADSVKVSTRSLKIFCVAIVGQLVLVGGESALRHQTALGGIIGLIFFVPALAGLWLLVCRELPHATVRWTQLIPGSLFYAVGIVCVELFNSEILGKLVNEKASTYGTLGIAAAILLALFLAGRVIVGAAVVNATLYARRSHS
jgi:uncharacterized BrkB/YihY/UPF0761 family membrane protein